MDCNPPAPTAHVDSLGEVAIPLQDLPDSGIGPRSPALREDFLTV